jgi:hypothetical protein
MERNLVATALVTAGLVSALATGACSISNSSETISDSISSPFEWSSDSSGSSSDSSGGDSAYRRDVSDYTVAFAHRGGELDAYRSGLRQLATQRGITNWEEDRLTCASIGLGLQQADFDSAAALAFAKQLLGEEAPGLEALRTGYASIP